MKITAKDFFLNLGAIVVFYTSIVALLALLFEVINYAFPKITNTFFYYTPSISMEVATLIVAFPLFLLLSWIIEKGYRAEPSTKDNWVRRWLVYITLFIAGGVVVGDLITVIYMYLDGQEITTAFILKVLTLGVVMGGVFAYFLRDVRNIMPLRERKLWRYGSAIFILAAIVLGFLVVGSPRDQRSYRSDMQKVSDLQSLQWTVVNYWQQKGALPTSLALLNDPIKGGYVPKNPDTGEFYEYNKLGELKFELCAEFKKASEPVGVRGASMMRPPYEMMGPQGENWQHQAGRQCFERTIDPDFYPKR